MSSSGLAREQQLDALHRFGGVPVLLSLSQSSLVLDRTLASAGSDAAWVALCSRMRLSSAMQQRTILSPSLYACAVRARAQLGQRAVLRGGAEVSDVSVCSGIATSGISASLFPSFQQQRSDSTPKHASRTWGAAKAPKARGWLNFKSNAVPCHTLSMYAGCNDLRSTNTNQITYAPLEASAELASKNGYGPLEWRIGVLHGTPVRNINDVPQYSQRSTIASAGAALSFSRGFFKRPSSSKRPRRTLSPMPVRSHKASADVCTGCVLRGTQMHQPGRAVAGGDERLNNRQSMKAGAFLAATLSLQLGQLARNFADYTALCLKLDTASGAGAPHEHGIRESDGRFFSAITASAKQQLFGPVRLGISSQLPLLDGEISSATLSLQTLGQHARKQADSVIELDAPIPQAAHAVRFSLSYALQRGEGVAELRALEM